MKVLVYGYGMMGKKVADKIRKQKNMTVAAIVSYTFDEKTPEKQYQSLRYAEVEANVIIDFSHPNNIDDILSYALRNHTKVVFATTGYTTEQLKKIEEAAKEIAIFQSYNTAFGMQMVTKILREASNTFFENGFDIEIFERHHNQKIDAPSGTAKLLYEVMEEEIEGVVPVYDRSATDEKRSRHQIGLQSMRGGTIFGEHSVYFAGDDEVIEIKHTALSKEVFVQGAIHAAKLLQEKEIGLYTLKTLY